MYADKITDIRLNSLITQLYVSKIIMLKIIQLHDRIRVI
jgi:hypothetical protein